LFAKKSGVLAAVKPPNMITMLLVATGLVTAVTQLRGEVSR
jgi:hypothetical protein